MGRKVICYIQAFDCEKTIEAAMQSILNQTYENWICFVLSNGNQAPNYSFDTIKAFAARDRRFVVLNKKYNLIDMYIPMLYHLAKHFPDSYICSLDADDEYKSDFFERAIALAEENHLDIVACGTEIILKKRPGSKKETLIGKRQITDNCIIEKEAFAHKFAVYKPFFNEMWGKLYSTGLFQGKYDRKYAQKNFFLRFLPDTLFTVDNLSRSSAIGILSGTSHKFYQFQQRNMTNATAMTNEFAANRQRKVVFRNWNSPGKFSVYNTYETIMSFLRFRSEMNEELYEYMQAVLFGWFWDFYTRTLLLTTNEAKLADHAFRLVFHEKFDELMQYKDSGKYNNLKHYESRREFCQLLRNTLICQEIIKNRAIGKRRHLNCTASTKRKLEKVVTKLNHMIERLSELQLKEEK